MTLSLLKSFSVADYSLSARGGVQQIPFTQFSGSITNPTLDSWGASEILRQLAANADPALFHVPQLPSGAILSITALVAAWTGTPHGALPAVMPTLTLQGYDIAGIAGTLYSQTDPSASVVAYEGVHSIVVATLGVELMSGKTYLVNITGESGANSQVGLRIAKLYATIIPES